MKREYDGAIVDIIFHNRENGYTVAVFETAQEDCFTVVGTMPGVSRGRRYRITGEFVVNSKYGEQFAISYCEELMPTGEEGMRDFLASASIKGIGKKTAAAIVARFGEDTFDIIENNPDRLTEIPGIGPKVSKRVAVAFAKHRELAKVTMKLQQYGISPEQTLRLYRVYGGETADVVMTNPYQLAEEVHGIGFRKADDIASKIGISPDDEYRIRSGVKYTLQWFAGEGNTFLPQDELREKAGEMLDQPRSLIDEQLEQMAFMGDVRIDIVRGVRVVYLEALYRAEQSVCKSIRTLKNSNLKPIQGSPETLITRSEGISGIKLSEQQKRAVTSCLGSGVSIITGGQGTGKTTIINAIIDILEDSGIKTAIAAPTGRAAKRITETSGHPASTIHRLLGYSFYESGGGKDGSITDDTPERGGATTDTDIGMSSGIGGGVVADTGFAGNNAAFAANDKSGSNTSYGYMAFAKNEDEPLDCDALVIDEASMIDITLMDCLLRALKPGTRLIIVGDEDQLPSIGPGNVLRDMIASEYVFTSRLTEIFRQAGESMIVVNAHRINKGEYPQCNAQDKDFFFMRRNTETEMIETIKELCLKRLPEYYKDIVKGGIRVTRDIQVLTPLRKGNIGSVKLNVELQSVMNPPAPEKAEKTYRDIVFREGDKVMQIRNNYQLKWKNSEDFTEGEGVFNGDMGYIQGIDEDAGEVIVVFDEVKYVSYEFSQLDELELAYAVTVHKSQGSEFPIVVMPMSWFPPTLATRNLLYTGVTRGKKVVVLVGSESRMNAMVDNNSISRRYSGLDWRLENLIQL